MRMKKIKNKDEVTVDDEDDVVEINDDDENDDDDDDDYSFEQQDDDIDQDLTVDDEDDDKDEKKKRKRKTVVEIKYDDENDDDYDDDYVEKVDQYEEENHKKKENKKTKKIQDQIIQFENNNIQPKNKRNTVRGKLPDLVNVTSKSVCQCVCGKKFTIKSAAGHYSNSCILEKSDTEIKTFNALQYERTKKHRLTKKSKLTGLAEG